MVSSARRLQEAELRYRHIRDVVAMLLAAGLVLLFGSAAFVLGITGHEWLAGSVFTTTVLGLGTIFVLRERPVSVGTLPPRSGSSVRGMSRSSLDRVREIALRLPEAHEEETWGHPTFRVNKKIFATATDESMSCKADPDERAALTVRPWVFEPPYVARHGWIGVQFDAVDDWDEISELLDTAYRMTAPTRLLQ